MDSVTENITLLRCQYFMVDQMCPKRKMALFRIKKGWFWRFVRFMTQPPFEAEA